MGQALYRKYRSKSLDEIVGQEHIITALKTALKEGRLSHAYLFTGPRGVGKTSIARILAHEINGLAYTEEDNHLDIIEIDAASNRGIDEIRDLREKVHISPTTGKYKVYIIDEVHMLTPQAFNALLKTLEEPPAHVVFILATTEVHKLPATIISRTQRYSFKPAEQGPLVAHLRAIASKEHIDISDEALELLAEHGDGSFRDSVGLLDQIGGGIKKISIQDVQELLGIAPKEAIDNLISTMSVGALQQMVDGLQALFLQGFQAATIAKQVGTSLRSSLLDGTPPLPPTTLLSLAKELLRVPRSHDPARFLELTLLGALTPAALPEVITPTIDSAPVPPAVAKKQPLPKPAPIKTASTTINTTETLAAEVPKPAKPARQKRLDGVTMDAALWPEVLNALKKEYNTLYSIVRMAEPQFEARKITLTFSFAFHQKRLNEVKNKTILNNVIETIAGEPIEIVCLYDKNVKPNPLGITPDQPADESMNTISSIFGGGEVIDS
ncbi:MAG: DNA polymerase III subunit gamma/tau [Candidatus Saccharimonadales bacterium]